jgi:hypothetical protein
VDGVLYNIHQYFLRRDSSVFAGMIGRAKGQMDDHPIKLEKTQAHEFDLFLSILYPL